MVKFIVYYRNRKEGRDWNKLTVKPDLPSAKNYVLNLKRKDKEIGCDYYSYEIKRSAL